MTCKDNCIHYSLCKDTVADENWTDEAPEFLKEMYSPKGCENFSPKQKVGTWFYYSTTMMECSECKKHVPRHRYKYCPECGSAMIPKVQVQSDKESPFVQLTIFDLNQEVNNE